MYGGVIVYMHVFLTLALDCERSASCSGPFAPGEIEPRTPWLGGWIGLTAGRDDVEERILLTPQGLLLRPQVANSAGTMYAFQLRLPFCVVDLLFDYFTYPCTYKVLSNFSLHFSLLSFYGKRRPLKPNSCKRTHA
jgi:hypothetical protein